LKKIRPVSESDIEYILIDMLLAFSTWKTGDTPVGLLLLLGGIIATYSTIYFFIYVHRSQQQKPKNLWKSKVNIAGNSCHYFYICKKVQVGPIF
jgi:hypothetical protein